MSLTVIQKGTTTLTCPKVRVITSTMWEVNMTRKYRVASCAIVLMRDGILSPSFSDRIARKIVNENARKSDEHMSPAG